MTTAAANNQQNNNNISEEEEKRSCRICHGSDEDEDAQMGGIDQEWIQPCKCSGSIKWVHRGCFEAWHGQAPTQQRIQCSICSHVFRFSLRFKSRWFTKLPIRLWLGLLLHLLTMLWLLCGLFVKMTKLAFTFYELQLLRLEVFKLRVRLFALQWQLAERNGQHDNDDDDHTGLTTSMPICKSLFEQSIQNAI